MDEPEDTAIHYRQKTTPELAEFFAGIKGTSAGVSLCDGCTSWLPDWALGVIDGRRLCGACIVLDAKEIRDKAYAQGRKAGYDDGYTDCEMDRECDDE